MFGTVGRELLMFCLWTRGDLRKDGIQAFLDQYDEFKLTAVGVTETTTGQTVESLGTVLYMALTTLVSGNDTLASTMGYSKCIYTFNPNQVQMLIQP